MTSLLQPTYSLVLGSQEWTEQLLGLNLRLEAAPLVDSLSVRLPVEATMSAGVGDEVKLTLASGEKEEDVFSGVIDSIRRAYGEIEVRALDAGGVLSRVRPATTYEQLSAGELIKNLCGDAGVDTGDIEDGVQLAFYVADPMRTAYEHVARLAAWSGAMARVSSENKLESVVVNGAKAEVAFKYGREFLALDQRKIDSSIDSFIVAGESDGSDLRPVTDFFAGARPDGPSASHVWRWEPALRKTEDAGKAGAAKTRIYKSGRQRGTFTAFLQPDLRPGTVLEIQELPEGLEGGPFWLTGVSHHLSPKGSWTKAHFYQGGDAFDPMALLGSLLGGLF